MVERDAGNFEKRRIETGEATNGSIPIIRGLNTGEHVVVDGAALLRDR